MHSNLECLTQQVPNLEPFTGSIPHEDEDSTIFADAVFGKNFRFLDFCVLRVDSPPLTECFQGEPA